MRLLLLLILAAPLHALAVQSGDVELVEIRAEITVRPAKTAISAEYSSLFRLKAGKRDTIAVLTLPAELGAQLRIQGIDAQPEKADGRHRWQVPIGAGASVDVSSSHSVAARRLPHEHVLGKWRVEFPLSLVRGFRAYPETATLALHWHDLPAELFGATGDATHLPLTHPIRGHPSNETVEFMAATLAEKTTEISAQLQAFATAQRVHTNRAYTSALVTMAELQAMAGAHAALAETCAILSALEVDAGSVISHCGPWARWRKHVPWQLRRVAALAAAGANDATMARQCVKDVSTLWQTYALVSSQARPFADFKPEVFGNYWDYDWTRTRELYVQALELAGERELASRIRAGENS
ncbi:MAG: hypothetical protein KF696_00645 [Planctomycetes bacterium]|nr:hypothetical protein [Planctomycetota bacterium]MCW8134553.1 hypothetical protein [Planctomycetota bacterium]